MAAKAPTPVPHVPINLLKGGGSAMFSANCVQLLAAVGFSPEDFGSYSQLTQRISSTRRRVNRIARVRDARARREEREAEPLPPTLAQHQGIEVAHLGQNSVRQRQRGNPCTNLVDGHDDGAYPCVLLRGPALVDGAPNMASEHGRMTADEQAHAVQGGRQREGRMERDRVTGDVTSGPPNPRRNGEDPAPASRYPADQMARDERARIDNIINGRRPNDQPTGQAARDGQAAAQPSVRAQASMGAYQANLAAPAESRASMPPASIDGESAAECIDMFKKMAEEAMRQRSRDEVANNEAAAGTPAERTAAARERRRIRRRADRMAQRAADLRRERGNARRAATVAQKRVDRLTAAGAPQADINAAQAQLTTARSNLRERERQREIYRAERIAANAEERAQAAARTHSRLRNADCRAEQGRRLQGNSGRVDGRAPPAGEPVDETENAAAPAGVGTV